MSSSIEATGNEATSEGGEVKIVEAVKSALQDNMQSLTDISLPQGGEPGDINPEFLRLKTEGNDFYNKGDFEKALQKYSEAMAHAKDDEQIAALLHNRGVTCEKMGNTEGALEAFNEAVKKRPQYSKVLKRRCKLFLSMKKYPEAMEDLAEVSFLGVKNREETSSDASTIPPLFIDLLTDYTNSETMRITAERQSTTPPIYVIEAFLRPFYADPVSRLWKGLDKSPVDDLIAEGKADALKGYLAAVRDLKLKKYDNISQLCTDEISNPESEQNQINAYFLRGTMSLIWAMTDNTVSDFKKVINSTMVDDKLKSSAYLKLALRHTVRHNVDIQSLAEEFAKAEELYPQNPDVYFHGAMTMVDRAYPEEAITMLDAGLKICGISSSVLMQTLYWTLVFSLTNDEVERGKASSRLISLEPEFDTPECYELYAQSFVMIGEAGVDKVAELMDKAIACNPTDPVYKMKKVIISRWGGDKVSESIDDLNKILETDGECGVAYYHIGHLEFLRGNLEKGFASLEKSIELSSSIHEIQARVASKLEMQFHMAVNEKLKECGLSSLADQVATMALKSFA